MAENNAPLVTRRKFAKLKISVSECVCLSLSCSDWPWQSRWRGGGFLPHTGANVCGSICENEMIHMENRGGEPIRAELVWISTDPALWCHHVENGTLPLDETKASIHLKCMILLECITKIFVSHTTLDRLTLMLWGLIWFSINSLSTHQHPGFFSLWG